MESVSPPSSTQTNISGLISTLYILKVAKLSFFVANFISSAGERGKFKLL